MNNINEQNVDDVLQKIDEKAKTARYVSLAITIAAVLIAGFVLYGLYSEVAEKSAQKKALNLEIEKLNEEIEIKKQQVANNVKAFEDIKKITDCTDDSGNTDDELQKECEGIKDDKDIKEGVNKIIAATEQKSKEQSEGQNPTTVANPSYETLNLPAKTLTSNINLRKDPNLEAEILATLDVDVDLTVISYTKEKDTWGGTTANWAKVRTPSGEGYIFTPLISVEKEKKALPKE